MTTSLENLQTGSDRREWRRLVVLVLAILLLAFADVIVLERIYKPVAKAHAIPWSEFDVTLRFAGRELTVLWWHVAYSTLGVGLFLLAGLAAKDWRLALAGCAAFAGGLQDIAYYAIQLEGVPDHLPWLDSFPTISWTRFATRTEHVTRAGLFLSAAGGTLLALWASELPQRLLREYRARRSDGQRVV